MNTWAGPYVQSKCVLATKLNLQVPSTGCFSHTCIWSLKATFPVWWLGSKWPWKIGRCTKMFSKLESVEDWTRFCSSVTHLESNFEKREAAPHHNHFIANKWPAVALHGWESSPAYSPYGFQNCVAQYPTVVRHMCVAAANQHREGSFPVLIAVKSTGKICSFRKTSPVFCCKKQMK